MTAAPPSPSEVPPSRAKDLAKLLGTGCLSILVVLGAIAGYFAFFAPKQHTVAMRLSGTATRAHLGVSVPGTDVSETVDLPWSQSATVTGNVQVALHGNARSEGDITCEILVDGQPWRRATAHGDGSAVHCLGFVEAP
jgi:uncharacterized protein YceK